MRTGFAGPGWASDKGQNTDLQLNELHEFDRKRGWESLEYVYEGISGSKVQRPNLDEMLVAVRKRKIDAVVVWRMDRLGRIGAEVSPGEPVIELDPQESYEEIKKCGVHVINVDPSHAIDSGTYISVKKVDK